MNLKTSIILVAAVGSLLLTASSGFAQGALTPPPGPPGPTMLTLSQIEPRTPVATNTTPGDANDLYIISQPGSYYLTANLVAVGSENGIEILANNVTLDLNGFTLQGLLTNVFYTSNNGIYIPNAQTNIIVRNGLINSWSQGVFSLTSTSANLVFEHLNCAGCYNGPGYSDAAMNILGAAVIRDCTFENNYYGIGCNGDNTGAGSEITGCMANDGVNGIECGGSGIISGCTANNCTYFGIAVYNANGFVVSGCNANNDLYGIDVYGGNNRIEDNHVKVTTGNFGIAVSGSTNNIIIRNSVMGGGSSDYLISGSQIVGPMITTPGTITSANPWANFSF
jgi:parallel beta-helix repeat protein